MITIYLKDRTVIKDVGLIRIAENGLGIFYYLRLPIKGSIRVEERPRFQGFRMINEIKYEEEK